MEAPGKAGNTSRLHLLAESRGHLHAAQVPPVLHKAPSATSCKDLMHFTFNCRSERFPRLLPCRETPRCCGEGEEEEEEEGLFLQPVLGNSAVGHPN